MSDVDLTYEDVLVTLGDIAATSARVHVFIAGQTGAFVAGLGGRLRRVQDGPFLDALRVMYVAKGGDEDFAAFFVHDGEEGEDGPCFAICRSFFQTATAVSQEDLEQGEGAGLYWRALTIFVGGVAINIGVQADEEAI